MARSKIRIRRGVYAKIIQPPNLGYPPPNLGKVGQVREVLSGNSLFKYVVFFKEKDADSRLAPEGTEWKTSYARDELKPLTEAELLYHVY